MTIAVDDSAIRVHGLRKSFPKVSVLQGVDFEVAAGSIFALLGSNGAGKTTVIRILATLLGADAGEALVTGYDVSTGAADVRRSCVPSERCARHRIRSMRTRRGRTRATGCGGAATDPGVTRCR